MDQTDDLESVYEWEENLNYGDDDVEPPRKRIFIEIENDSAEDVETNLPKNLQYEKESEEQLDMKFMEDEAEQELDDKASEASDEIRFSEEESDRTWSDKEKADFNCLRSSIFGQDWIGEFNVLVRSQRTTSRKEQQANIGREESNESEPPRKIIKHGLVEEIQEKDVSTLSPYPREHERDEESFEAEGYSALSSSPLTTDQKDMSDEVSPTKKASKKRRENCMYYSKGLPCKRGQNCHFIHEDEFRNATIGANGEFSVRQKKNCIYYCRGLPCKKGERCRFIHDDALRNAAIAATKEEVEKSMIYGKGVLSLSDEQINVYFGLPP